MVVFSFFLCVCLGGVLGVLMPTTLFGKGSVRCSNKCSVGVLWCSEGVLWYSPVLFCIAVVAARNDNTQTGMGFGVL